MGKNMSLYLSDDVLELIGAIEGKGTLINELIREHFSNDEETLRMRVQESSRELDILKLRLTKAMEKRLHRETQANLTTAQHKKAEKRALAVAEHQRKWKAGEISDAEYWAFFD